MDAGIGVTFGGLLRRLCLRSGELWLQEKLLYVKPFGIRDHFRGRILQTTDKSTSSLLKYSLYSFFFSTPLTHIERRSSKDPFVIPIKKAGLCRSYSTLHASLNCKLRARMLKALCPSMTV